MKFVGSLTSVIARFNSLSIHLMLKLRHRKKAREMYWVGKNRRWEWGGVVKDLANQRQTARGNVKRQFRSSVIFCVAFERVQN